MCRHTPCPIIHAYVPKLLAAGGQSLLELIHSTACIDKLLLTGKEGVAFGADFNSDLAALGRTGGNSFTACALNNDFLVIGMDSCLHFHILLSEFAVLLRDLDHKA